MLTGRSVDVPTVAAVAAVCAACGKQHAAVAVAAADTRAAAGGTAGWWRWRGLAELWRGERKAAGTVVGAATAAVAV